MEIRFENAWKSGETKIRENALNGVKIYGNA